MTYTELPIRCARPGGPDTAGRGFRICQGCATLLGQALRRLPVLYRQCGDLHLRSPAQAWEKAPSRARPGPTVPLHAPATDARQAVETVLASWAGLTVQATRTAAPPRVVVDLCRFLLGRFPFLLRHPAAGELVAEVAGLLAEVERVLRPDHGRAPGPCVVSGCEGRLTGGRERELRREPGARLERPRGVVARCPEPAVRGEPRWLSAAGITALWGITRGSVYRLACENGWGRRTYEVTGPRALSFTEACAIISAASGRPLTFDGSPEHYLRTQTGLGRPEPEVTAELAAFAALADLGDALPRETVAQVTGRPARSFEEYAAAATARRRRP